MRSSDKKNYRYKTTRNDAADFWEALAVVFFRSGRLSFFGLLYALLQDLPLVDQKNYEINRIRLAEQFTRFYWFPLVRLQLEHAESPDQPFALAEEIAKWNEGNAFSFTEVSEFDRMQLIASVNRNDLERCLADMYTDMQKLPFSFSRGGHTIVLNPYFYRFLQQNRDILYALNLVKYADELVSRNPDFSFVELLLLIDENTGDASHTDFRYFFDAYAPRLIIHGIDLSGCRTCFREFLEFQADSMEDAVLADKIRNMDLARIGVKSYRPVPEPKDRFMIRNGIRITERDPKKSVNALLRAELSCEVDPAHPLFLRKKDHLPCTKPLHLIPLHYSSRFECSLDVEANIVSLCPLCYEKIKYSDDAEAQLRELYMLRKPQLEKCGIRITVEELLAMYGISAAD